MPLAQHGHGDLYVEYNVVLPTVLSKDVHRSESAFIATGWPRADIWRRTCGSVPWQGPAEGRVVMDWSVLGYTTLVF